MILHAQGKESFQQPQFLLQAQLSTSHLLLLMTVLKRSTSSGTCNSLHRKPTHIYTLFHPRASGQEQLLLPNCMIIHKQYSELVNISVKDHVLRIPN